MADRLLLKTNEEPTFWNKEAAIGFFIAPVLGFVVGGLIGKERMKREKELGKTVTNNPSFWNKDTLLGGLIGSLIGGLIAGITFLSIVAGSTTLAPVGLATMAVLQLALPVGAVIGAYLGGKHGQENERREYMAAQQQMQQASSRSLAPEIAQEQSAGKSHAQRIEQERMLAAAQANTR